jgi:hypothetical protein
MTSGQRWSTQHGFGSYYVPRGKLEARAEVVGWPTQLVRIILTANRRSRRLLRGDNSRTLKCPRHQQRSRCDIFNTLFGFSVLFLVGREDDSGGCILKGTAMADHEDKRAAASPFIYTGRRSSPNTLHSPYWMKNKQYLWQKKMLLP